MRSSLSSSYLHATITLRENSTGLEIFKKAKRRKKMPLTCDPKIQSSAPKLNGENLCAKFKRSHLKSLGDSLSLFLSPSPMLNFAQISRQLLPENKYTAYIIRGKIKNSTNCVREQCKTEVDRVKTSGQKK